MYTKIKQAASIRNAATPEYPNLAMFRNDLILCYRALSSYAEVLEDWLELYAPKCPGEPRDNRYREARKMLPSVYMLLDCLTIADFKERYAMVQKLMEDGCIAHLRSYVAPFLSEKYGLSDLNRKPERRKYMPN